MTGYVPPTLTATWSTEGAAQSTKVAAWSTQGAPNPIKKRNNTKPKLRICFSCVQLKNQVTNKSVDHYIAN